MTWQYLLVLFLHSSQQLEAAVPACQGRRRMNLVLEPPNKNSRVKAFVELRLVLPARAGSG